MITQQGVSLEPLTYWLRIEDIVMEPGIGVRLTEQAVEGVFLLQTGGDLMRWIEESESLLRLIDRELHRTAGVGYPDLVDIAMATPQVESLQSLLATVPNR